MPDPVDPTHLDPVLPPGVKAPAGVDEAGLAAVIEAALRRPAERSRRQLERLAVLAVMELARDLTDGPGPTVQRIVEMIDPLLPECGGVSVILYDPVMRSFQMSASTVPDQATGESATRVRPRGATHFVATTGQGIYVRDIANDPFGANAMLRETENHSYVGLPIRAGQDVLGVMYAMGHAVSQFDDEDLELLAVVADRSAMVIQAATEHARVRRIALHSEALSMLTARFAATDDPVALIPKALEQVAMVADLDALVLLPGSAAEAAGLVAVAVGRASDHPGLLTQRPYVEHQVEQLPKGRALLVEPSSGPFPGLAIAAFRERAGLDDLDRKTLLHLSSVLCLPFRQRPLI